MNAQTYQNRTCELVFAGLERATDFEDVRQFCIVSQKIIHQAEAALFGVKSLLDRSLGKILLMYNNNHIFSFCIVKEGTHRWIASDFICSTSY